jgi:hypothetical protein
MAIPTTIIACNQILFVTEVITIILVTTTVTNAIAFTIPTALENSGADVAVFRTTYFATVDGTVRMEATKWTAAAAAICCRRTRDTFHLKPADVQRRAPIPFRWKRISSSGCRSVFSKVKIRSRRVRLN